METVAGEKSFAALNLSAEMLESLAAKGYRAPTDVQAEAIPKALSGRDLVVQSRTGTGKTAAYGVPLAERIDKRRDAVQAVVLAPTRELAVQVAQELAELGRGREVKVEAIYGGDSMDRQLEGIRAGAHVIVGTPGRVLDHLRRRTLRFDAVRTLVLDEADRMLDMGFIPDIKRILAVLPPRRQNLLFSATFPDEVRRLAKELLRSPVTIEVAPRNAPPELVTHQVYSVPAPRKRALLVHLIRARDMRQVLVFVRMKRDANRLARQLVQDGVVATAIHSDRTQGERMQALEDFKEGRVPVLVATDIAARGLDIEELPYVINFELPHTPEDYVHRIGRTGRAGLPGEAISLASPEELKFLEDIERLLKRKLPRVDAPEFRAGGSASRDRRLVKTRTAEIRSVAPGAAAPSAASGFDFTKPYEPAAASTPPAARPPMPSPHERRQRPTAALLGGLAPKTGKK